MPQSARVRQPRHDHQPTSAITTLRTVGVGFMLIRQALAELVTDNFTAPDPCRSATTKLPLNSGLSRIHTVSTILSGVAVSFRGSGVAEI